MPDRKNRLYLTSGYIPFQNNSVYPPLKKLKRLQNEPYQAKTKLATTYQPFTVDYFRYFKSTNDYRPLERANQ